MHKPKDVSQTDELLSPEEISAIRAVWSELPRIDPRAEEPELFLSRLLLGTHCLKLASKLETPCNGASDTALRLKELREIVILQVQALADYDDPNAKALQAKLIDLLEWWSSQPRHVSFGCC
jgi:hypothetical protein